MDSKNNYLKSIGNGRYSILKWIDSNAPELCVSLIDDVLRLDYQMKLKEKNGTN